MYKEEMDKKLEEIRQKKSVKILAIESSCDETSIAVVENGRNVLSCVTATQIDIHKRFGGVVPEVASRNHILAIENVCKSEKPIWPIPVILSLEPAFSVATQ